MKTIIRFFIVVISIFTTSQLLFSQERYSKVSIPVSSREDIFNIAKLGISLEGASGRNKDHIDLFVSEQEARLLRENGIGFTTIIPDWDAYYTERQKQDAALVPDIMSTSTVKNFHLGSMGGFLTLAELEAELDSMRIKFPGLITARESIGVSYENRSLWAVRISKSQIPGSQPQALYMGLHHAREPIGMMSLVYFMWYLLENYGTDPEVTMLLDNRELWFIPIVNPDGYIYNQQNKPSGGGTWRKNRHAFSSSYGVDLNRNYGFKWGFDDIGSSPLSTDGAFRGTAAFSELETQAIRDFVKKHKFKTAVTFHAYADMILSPWGYANKETDDSVMFRALEMEMSAVNRYSFGADILYATNGDACDWLYGDTLSKPEIIPFTIEVGADYDGFWPVTSRILPLVMENLRPNLLLARAADTFLRVDKTNVTYQFNSDSVFVAVPFINAGTAVPTGLLDISVSSPDLNIAIKQFNGYDWRTSGKLTIAARKNKPVGAKASMIFDLTYQGGKTTDTITFRLGPADVLYADDAEATRSNWLAASNVATNWDTTHEQSHSGLFSFTQSPYKIYPDNLTSTLTLAKSFTLNGVASELRFWLKGRSEVDYDCLRAEICYSEFDFPWIPLTGRFTSPGSGAPTEQPFGSPVLDGYKYEWVEEIMDLTEYLGKTIKLRFRFTSDPGLGHNGFYIDDITLLSYGKAMGIHFQNDITPTTFSLEQNFPNPFNPSTTIRYALPSSAHVKLIVYDLLGREIATLVNEEQSAGWKEVQWNASTLNSGIYFFRLQSGNFTDIKKMVLMK